jgi:TonB family protein
MKRWRRFVAISIGCVSLAMVAWLDTSRTTGPLPPVPDPPNRVAELVPPPPPGPPPTLPGEKSVAFTYGTASYVPLGTGPAPRRLTDQRPIYPPIARLNGIAGTVVLDATIDGLGRVVDPIIRQSVPMLDQAAVDAVRQWRFEPRPVSQSQKQSIRASVSYR